MPNSKKNLLFLPGPVTVAEPVLAAMSRPLIDHRGPAFAALLERIDRAMRPVFGTAQRVLVLGASGTGGLEASLVSLFSPGDKLLACPLGAFGRRYIAIARTYGCEVEILETQAGHAPDLHVLRERLRADTKKEISGILLTHNETSTGVQMEMRAVSEAIGDHGAITLVDSVSGMGGDEFTMDAWRFDAVVTASQKVFSAPPGVAMVALSARAIERLKQAKTPAFYFSLAKAIEFAEIGQTPWTPPISVLYALDVALARYHAEGPQSVWRRHASYARAIRAAVGALGLEIFSAPGAHSNTVVAVKASPGMDVARLLKQLREERGVCLSGGQLELKGKIFRIGTMGDISQTDVLGMLGALEIALLEQDLPVHLGRGVQAALRVFLEIQDGAKPGGAQTTAARTVAQTTEARS
ncbi:MAG: alanine--glyoxylate aminotransferase family protein [Candidatus Eremiobacteraeota bacterium]|nr:alanine--glyoxylate aminotransferase family protein [Candidatus Eremiobacteraeota bacterium]